MSYSGTTPNIGLPQWVLSDAPQMADFNNAFSDIDSFVQPVSLGGTGATTAQSAFNNIVAPGGTITGNLDLSNPLSIESGGTGATTAAGIALSHYHQRISRDQTDSAAGVGITASGALAPMSGSGWSQGNDLGTSSYSFGTLYSKQATLSGNGASTLVSPYWETAAATSAPNAIFDGNGGLRRTSGSSKRFKRNIVDLTVEEANKVLELRPVEFEFKLDPEGKKRNGFIAEEVMEITPQFVDYTELEDGEIQCDNVRYGEITAALLVVLKEQKKEIENLKSEIEKIKGASS